MYLIRVLICSHKLVPEMDVSPALCVYLAGKIHHSSAITNINQNELVFEITPCPDCM